MVQQLAKLNFAKEPFSPSHSNPKTADAQETKNGASIEVKCLIINKGQHATRYIKHLMHIPNFNAVTFNMNCIGLTGYSPKCQTFHMRRRYHHLAQASPGKS